MSKPIILVTGAASGIGAAICRVLARPGISLLMHTRGGANGDNLEKFEQVVEEVRGKGAYVATTLADLSEKGASERLVDAALTTFGGLDQIVSNAGFAIKAPIGEVSRLDFDRSYETITGAFFDLATAALHPLSRSNCGCIVAISSFVAHRYASDALFPVTSAAKSAMEALAKSLAVQLGPIGVTVNCVAPGYTQKDKGAHRAISSEALRLAREKAVLNRIARPVDIAHTVKFLLSRNARHITGQTIRVDGGLSISS